MVSLLGLLEVCFGIASICTRVMNFHLLVNIMKDTCFFRVKFYLVPGAFMGRRVSGVFQRAVCLIVLVWKLGTPFSGEEWRVGISSTPTHHSCNSYSPRFENKKDCFCS